MLRGLPPAQAADNLDAILAELQRRQIPVLLAGMRAAPNLGPIMSARSRRCIRRSPAIIRRGSIPFFLDGVAGTAR